MGSMQTLKPSTSYILRKPTYVFVSSKPFRCMQPCFKSLSLMSSAFSRNHASSQSAISLLELASSFEEISRARGHSGIFDFCILVARC